MRNINGEFKVILGGKERTLKATFGAIEKLEGGMLPKSIMETLQSVMAGKVTFNDVVSVFMVGIEAFNNDTRMTRQQVGEAIFADGLVHHAKTYMEYLTYCITGGKESDGNTKGEAEPLA